jgi:hypothetical protein
MYMEVFFLFLVPLAVDAQQLPGEAELNNDPVFAIAMDVATPVAPAPDRAVPTSMPAGAPAARTGNERTEAENDRPGNDNDKSALPAEVYEPKVPKESTPPIKNNTVFTTKFIAVHAALLASTVYDAEVTHQGLAHHKCAEGNAHLGTHPGRGKIYAESLLAFGAISGLDWLIARTRIRYLPYIAPTAETEVHLSGGSRWLAECW